MEVELIKALQKEKKISNVRVAELTGISESTVSRILARKTEPKFEDVVRIAVCLGASLDALAGIARNEAAEEKVLRAALEEREVQLEALREEHRKSVDFLMDQIAVRDRAIEHKDKTIEGLMQALLGK